MSEKEENKENKKEEIIPPFIKGRNVDLVPQSKNNIDQYANWVNDEEVRRLSRNMVPVIKEDIKKWIEPSDVHPKETIYFEIYHKKEKRPIGNVGFNNINWVQRKGEIGLTIGDKNLWGKGLATEAVNLILEYGFGELNLRKIKAGIFEPNIGSVKAAEKAGFKREAVLKNEIYIDGRHYSAFRYAIFKEDWLKMHEK
ncbi:MAG: Spermidine N(1)-acetyltransferase [Promethearchaeota archaeon]|nr:MAG: Spermidine N(1)-acetyltransferase [Candidatus Lokiarchaeota archaeon]